MTILAGVCSGSGGPPPKAIKDDLLANLTRADSGDCIKTFDHPLFFAAKLDIGAFDEPAVICRDSSEFAALTGDALIARGSSQVTRPDQVKELSTACASGDFSVLDQVRGTFSFARFETDRSMLWLISDPIGLRPIYYTLYNGMLIFASCLRIIESIKSLPRVADIVGISEQAAFNYPLGERTPYKGVSLMREGQILQFGTDGVQTRHYKDWSRPNRPTTPYSERVQKLYSTFMDSILLRSGTDSHVISYLSGGLDSRVITAILANRDVRISAFNFARANSQDHVFAKTLAKELGGNVALHCHPQELEGKSRWSCMIAAAICDLPESEREAVNNAKFVWSGDGGSVALGRVYMDQMVADWSDLTDWQAAVSYYIDFMEIRLPRKILRSGVREKLIGWPENAILQEILRYPCWEKGVSLFLFLMFNDQRRHLFGHFEDIDLHRIEFHLPFYDAKFIDCAMDFSSNEAIYHRLYMDWFQHAPKSARVSPWQTYPDHVPCPVESSGKLLYQWDTEKQKTFSDYRLRRKQKAAQLFRDSFQKDYPTKFLKVWIVRMAAVLSYLGIRDYKYLTDVSDIYCDYCSNLSRKT